MKKSEITGVLANPDGFLWLIQFTTGHSVSLGIEEFEGKLVKVIRTETKIIVEVIKDTEPIPWGQFHKTKELCVAGL